jgi:hypothetical protein
MEQRKEDWEGTARELLTLLNGVVGEKAAKEQEWPKRPNTLSNKLRRIAPALRKTGIHIDHHREAHGIRKIRIEYRSHPEDRPETSSPPSPSSDETAKSFEINDVEESTGDDHMYQGDDSQRSGDDGGGDDRGDDSKSTIVTDKPLRNKVGDDGDNGDDEITLSPEGLHGLGGKEAIEEEIRFRAEAARKPASVEVTAKSSTGGG